MFDIKDSSLTETGVARINWALQEMPVIRDLMQDLKKEQPLHDIRISACLHITTETANLARTLQAAGADVVLCASNPLSTQDDVAAALVNEYGIPVYAIRGESTDTYYQQIAEMKLSAIGIHIDRLTSEQDHYLSSWQEGT